MRILAIPPNRRDARSLPGKTRAFVTAGLMVRWAWEPTSGATGVNEAVVAAAERICRTVQGFGGQVFLTGPVLPSGTDREPATLESAGESFDIVLDLRGDGPAAEQMAKERGLA